MGLQFGQDVQRRRKVINQQLRGPAIPLGGMVKDGRYVVSQQAQTHFHPTNSTSPNTVQGWQSAG
jgi:hypothetical protein